MKRSIYVGFDPRERTAFGVALTSLTRHLSEAIPVHGLVLADLQARGLYTRPLKRSSDPACYRLWDVISDAPMATEHACARFLTGHLAKEGWALFMDGDVLVRDDIVKLFDDLDPRFAAYCVKHGQEQGEGLKMDRQLQVAYPKKNWSSVMALNLAHASNRALTLDLINTAPGRDLHAFCWLREDEIGALDPRWNHLVGVSPPSEDVAIAHFTLGPPDMLGYESVPFADEWRSEIASLAA